MDPSEHSGTVVITGGNAGLGFEAAMSIAASDRGLHVVLACRSSTRGRAAAETVRQATGNPNTTAMTLDLASFASVRAFAQELAGSGLPPLVALVCNAGLSAAGMRGTRRTGDGFEPIFAVNHLGHFLLANLLVPQMADRGRIVFVTSDLHDPPKFFPVTVTYGGAAKIAAGTSGMLQYCVSKLCNVYCAYELDARLRSQTSSGITVNAFNPGAMSDTGFSRPSGNVLVRAVVAAAGVIMGRLIGKQSTSAASGALLAALVTDPEHGKVTGAYFDRDVRAQSSPLSRDRDNARELWEASSAMTGLTSDESAFAASTR